TGTPPSGSHVGCRSARTAMTLSGRTNPGTAAGWASRVRATSADDGVAGSGPVQALQLPFAALLEREPRAGRQLVGRRGDQDLPFRCGCGDPCGLVDDDPSKVFTDHFDLPGVDPRSDPEAEGP